MNQTLQWEDRMARPAATVRARLDDECCTPSQPASLDDERASALARRFAALGDAARLKMLAMLVAAESGEVCVCDFAERLDRKQPNVSHHLKVLCDAGLITLERRGKWSWYSIRPEHLASVEAALVS
jgi:ArsR family transcriptional regulator